MWSPPSRSVFGSQVIRLFLVSLAMYLYGWRGWIRIHIYWDNK
jgi:hypothetical protein